MKINHLARIRLDTVLENCIFYISTMYEFSHNQDPEQTLKTPTQWRGRYDRGTMRWSI